MNTTPHRLLERGFAQAEALTRDYARTFHFASRFLSASKRRACYTLYAACRLCDRPVDAAEGPADPRRRLEEVRGRIGLAYASAPLAADPLMEALRDTVRTFDIPQRCFDDLIDGMVMDLTMTRYAGFGELYLYCYRVAGVVGLMLTRIFGAGTPQAEKFALDLGVAMRLTNILRDIREDYGRGRIYLPRDEMEEAGVTEEDIAAGAMTDGLALLLRRQVERARSYYREGRRGIESIIDRNARFAALLMAALYERILDKIERRRYNVFAQRAVVPLHEKLGCALLLLIRHA
ncbi:MAG: phytoene/squalene synthase family protein [Deltaproteobacteria bacterium]